MQTNFKSHDQTFVNAPIEKIWDALTQPEIVKKQFFGSDQVTNWKVGSQILWTGEFEGTTYEDKGIVQEFITKNRLAYKYSISWSGLADKPKNDLLVNYEVNETESGTFLTSTQSNYDEEKVKHPEKDWKIVIDGVKKIIE